MESLVETSTTLSALLAFRETVVTLLPFSRNIPMLSSPERKVISASPGTLMR